MSDLVVSTYVTLDGALEEPGWSGPDWSYEAQLFARDQLRATNALLLGRKTYEIFAASWPTKEWIEREGDFADSMNSLPKYVASTTLEEPLEWTNSVLLKGDIVDVVAKLKQASDQDLLMNGSVELMHTLMPQT